MGYRLYIKDETGHEVCGGKAIINSEAYKTLSCEECDLDNAQEKLRKVL